MLDFMKNFTNTEAVIILSLAIILLSGYFMAKLARVVHLPDVTGYILAGVLIGPYLLHLVPVRVIQGMDFVTDIALAYIAFGVGKYFNLSQLRQNGLRIAILTIFEALLAAILVVIAMISFFHLPLSFALLLGAIGSATAPASTIMTIRQYHAKGEMVNTVLQVVAFDDAVALIAFSICAAFAGQMSGNIGSTAMIIVPVLLNFVMLLFGAFCGVLLKWIVSGRSKDHRLILFNGVIFLLTGLCTFLNISPLLSCMVMGTVYVNIIQDKKLFKQVNHFSPPVMLMFFVLSGMKLDVPMLIQAGGIGVCYFLVRILGKYLGAYLGARVCGFSAEIRKYLGLALIPQAGVSIGLAALGQRMLPPETGSMLSTIILSSGILYELIGPLCAKSALFLGHAVPEQKQE